MRKRSILLTVLFISLIPLLNCCLTYANKVPENQPLPDSMFNPIPSENAQLRVSGHAAVKSFDGIEVNWGAGTISPIPAGRHTLVIMDTKYTSPQVSLEHDFLPGKCYMAGYDLETVREDVGRNAYTGTTTYREITTGTANLQGYGASESAVPGKNESLVEIFLSSQWGDDYTRLFMGGNYYKLSTYRNDAAESVRFILPAGTYRISSVATVNVIDLDLLPNRHVSITVDMEDVSIKHYDLPLTNIGKWHFDVGNNRNIILIFNTGGTGSIGMYNGNTLAEGSGAFTYTSTGKAITINSPGEPPITMPYRLTTDQNGLYLDNFLGSSVTYTGVR